MWTRSAVLGSNRSLRTGRAHALYCPHHRSRDHFGDHPPAAQRRPIRGPGRGYSGHFRRHLVQRYRVVELTRTLFDNAMLTARKHRLRAYDAVQLAVVLDVHRLQKVAGLGPVTLVSADRDLNKAAQAEGLAVEDPNQYP